MIRFGIIGCGSVSQTYLYTLDKNKDAEIVAVADPDVASAKKKAEPFGIRKIYPNYKEMLDNEKLNAVVIATPHFLHHGQAIECAKRGLHILCEKPLATNMKDILDMVEKCRNVKFGVMLQRRFYPNSISTVKALKKGALGKITNVSLSFTCHKSFDFYNTWRGKKISGGGVLISQALHRIDLLIYFFGKPVCVEGITKKTRDYIEVEDYAKGNVYFENGIIASIEANNSSGNPDTISVTKIKGTNGSITLSDDKTPEWNVNGLPKPQEVDINNIPTEFRPAYYGPCHEMVINDFVDSLVKNRELSIKAQDSIDAMKVIFGFYKSAEEKRKINLNHYI